MADPFIGEIRIFAGNFAPRDWTFCNGGTLLISQNTALFSIIGTIYGGNGRTDFGLPNLKGRAPLQAGAAPGLSNYAIGHTGGVDTVTITNAHMPTHNHNLRATPSPAEVKTPTGNSIARSVGGSLYHTGGTLVNMESSSLVAAGSGGSHNNLQPYLVVNFIIALNGLYPSRS